jgi:dihydropteroate synthase
LSNYQLQKQVFNNLAQAKAEIQKIGSDPGGVARMFTKAVHFCIKVENLRPKVCNIIKQDMLSLGGDAAVHKHVIDAKVETSDILIMGTVKQFHQLVSKLRAQPFSLTKLAEDIEELLRSEEVTG